MKHLLTLLAVISFVTASGQNVGIGTKNPKSKLHVAGSVRIDDLAMADSGLVLHNPSGVLSSLRFTGKKTDVLRGDGSFQPLASLSAAATDPYWTTTGNAGVDTAVNFLGTLDKVALRFRVNNTPAGAIDPLHQNVGLGLFTLLQNQTGERNVAIGLAALRFNKEGSYNVAIGTGALAFNQIGSKSIAIGGDALFSNTSGYQNIAIGDGALATNTTGFWNTALGFNALQKSTGSYHVAVGYLSLQKNTTGQNNTGTGYQALTSNTTGSYNAAFSYQSLLSNTTGSYNSGLGYKALFANTTGSNNVGVGFKSLELTSSGNNNVALGNNALRTNRTGSGNTAVGSGADVTTTALLNATALGSGAIVNASNKVRIGNASVTKIEGQVPFTTPSDGRYKFNVREDVRGLDFILRLRPVTYQFDVKRFDKVSLNQQDNNIITASYNKAQALRRTGFIAQEVEKAAMASGYNFSGINAPENEKDQYSLSYESFVVPLVKGMQEQQQIIRRQQEQILLQEQQIQTQGEQINELMKEIKDIKKKLASKP